MKITRYTVLSKVSSCKAILIKRYLQEARLYLYCMLNIIYNYSYISTIKLIINFEIVP